MKLNENQLNQLAKLVAQNLVQQNKGSQEKKENPYKGMSKKEIEKQKEKQKKIEREEYLAKKISAKKDTLAQRLEYEKLKFENKIPDWAKSTGKVVGTVTGGIGTGVGIAAKAAINSNLSKGLYKTLMYSNPLTALIAENSDLIKGVGKGIGTAAKFGLKGVGMAGGSVANFLYKKIRGKGKDDNTAAKELVQQKASISMKGGNGTNYISTKKATFVGGKTYISISAPSTAKLSGGAAGIFSQKLSMIRDNVTDAISSGKERVSGFISGVKQKAIGTGTAIKDNVTGLFSGVGNKVAGLLPGPVQKNQKDKDVIEMTKGIDGIWKQSKKSNMLLDLIKKKAIMIGAGVLLGVVAIMALAVAIKKYMANKNKNKPNKIKQLKSASQLFKKISEDPQKAANEIKQLKYVKPPKVNYTKTPKQNYQVKYTYKDEGIGSVVPSPCDGKIVHVAASQIKASSESDAEYDVYIYPGLDDYVIKTPADSLLYDRTKLTIGPTIRNGIFVVHHVYEAPAFAWTEKVVHKGDPIGRVGPSKQITIEKTGGMTISNTAGNFNESYMKIYDNSIRNQTALTNKAANQLIEHSDRSLKQIQTSMGPVKRQQDKVNEIDKLPGNTGKFINGLTGDTARPTSPEVNSMLNTQVPTGSDSAYRNQQNKKLDEEHKKRKKRDKYINKLTENERKIRKLKKQEKLTPEQQKKIKDLEKQNKELQQKINKINGINSTKAFNFTAENNRIVLGLDNPDIQFATSSDLSLFI